jgi:hypothetical protein
MTEVSSTRPVTKPARPCPNCARPADPNWTFCEYCAHDLRFSSASARRPPPPPQQHPLTGRLDNYRRRPSRRTLLIGVGATIVVALIAASVTFQMHTRNSLHRSEAQLASTQRQLANRSARLVTTQALLTEANTELTSQTAKLKESEDDLDGVRGTLADAKSKMNLQASQIKTLKTCLGGVSDALNYVASDDYDSALAALDAVQGSCHTAYALF